MKLVIAVVSLFLFVAAEQTAFAASCKCIPGSLPGAGQCTYYGGSCDICSGDANGACENPGLDPCTSGNCEIITANNDTWLCAGACPAGQSCWQVGSCCTPQTAAQVCGSGPACGTRDDGCGGQVTCGGCASGQVCQSNGSCCTPITHSLCRKTVRPLSAAPYPTGAAASSVAGRVRRGSRATRRKRGASGACRRRARSTRRWMAVAFAARDSTTVAAASSIAANIRVRRARRA